MPGRTPEDAPTIYRRKGDKPEWLVVFRGNQARVQLVDGSIHIEGDQALVSRLDVLFRDEAWQASLREPTNDADDAVLPEVIVGVLQGLGNGGRTPRDFRRTYRIMLRLGSSDKAKKLQAIERLRDYFMALMLEPDPPRETTKKGAPLCWLIGQVDPADAEGCTISLQRDFPSKTGLIAPRLRRLNQIPPQLLESPDTWVAAP